MSSPPLPGAPAREVPVGTGRDQRRQLRDRRDGHGVRRRVRGQRALLHTLPETLITVVGIEKLIPAPAGSRGLPPAAAAVVDRRAHEPVHDALDRRHPGRRAAGLPRRAAGQRPHRRPRRRTRPPDARLHPLQRLPQRLPGLLAHGRPRLRLGLPGPDRRDPDAAAARGREARSLPYASTLCGACYEVCPVKIHIPRVLVHLRGRVVEEGAAAASERVAMRGARLDLRR